MSKHEKLIKKIKTKPKDFTYKELKMEVERRNYLQPLYEFMKLFLSIAGLSVESVKYFATLIPFYSVYKLQRMQSAATQLYLLCFAYHRFRQINDNLIEAFIHWVGQFESQAKSAAEQEVQRLTLNSFEKLQA